MKIKRFVAADMRAAIRQVREEQGPEAVILSNRRVEGGIEVVAATDYDEALVRQAARMDAANQNTAAATSPPAPAAASTSSPATSTKSSASSQIVWAQDPAIAELRRELNSMRHTIENQLRSFSYELGAPSPQQAEAMQALNAIGIDPAIARPLVAQLPETSTPADARHLRSQALVQLARQLPVARTDSILYGGHVALIGPTGVGKTTTLAKLAAHYGTHRSPRDVALVSCDQYRIGAQDQLFTYGRMLGMPVHALQPGESLAQVLQRLADYKLVLIDTAGMSPRDPRLNEQLTALNAAGKLRTYLVLPASGQAQDLDDMAARFAAIPLAGCILTKLDETRRLGGALSVAMRRNLPITYVSDGQRVPEDLHRIEAHRLVLMALRSTDELAPMPNPISSTVTPEFSHARA